MAKKPKKLKKMPEPCMTREAIWSRMVYATDPWAEFSRLSNQEPAPKKPNASATQEKR